MPTNEQISSLYEVKPQGFDDFAVTPVSMTAVKGVTAKVLTLNFPAAPLYFGYRPTTAFSYNTLTTQGVLGLYRYPHGLTCFDLPSAIALCDKLGEAMNAHAADITMHKVADTTNFPAAVAPVSGSLGGLIAKVNLLQTAYAAHNVDANLGSAWVFHYAQVNHALADAVAVTTLATAIAKLNDMLAKYNLHDLSAVAHALGNLHPAYKVLLGTINLEDAAALNQQYMVKVANIPAAGVGVEGHAKRPVGDCKPQDQIAFEIVVQAAGGGYIAGAFQPVLFMQYRGEGFVNQPAWNDRTPVSAGISSAQ